MGRKGARHGRLIAVVMCSPSRSAGEIRNRLISLSSRDILLRLGSDIVKSLPPLPSAVMLVDKPYLIFSPINISEQTFHPMPSRVVNEGRYHRGWNRWRRHRTLVC